MARLITLFTLALLLISVVSFAQNVDLSRDKVLYGVVTSHLDTQWKWTIQETIDDCVRNTLRDQFALMEKYPDYTFSFEGAFKYMLMKEYYPEDYARLKDYIASGQWRVAGSSVDAGDSNVPSPESLFRHVLYGNGFFRKEFGKTSLDFFLPDSFGFSYVMPSVAANCGLKGFSTQKLSWGSAVEVPFDIGTWEGPDGSSIVAALKPGDYIATADRDYARDQGSIDKVDALGKSFGVWAGYRYFGVGDQGGGLNLEQGSWLQKSAEDKDAPIRFLCAGSDQLYRDLTPEQISRLPHYKGELVMTRHGTGCYTSHAAMKRWNRKNEQLADATERAAVAADWLGGAVYPGDKLKEAWVRFLWHQFHDDLTGTSIPQAYTFSWNDEILSQKQFDAIFENSVGAVSRALDTSTRGVPLVVYNPLSIEREDVVSASVSFPGGVPKAVRVYGPDGREVASQLGEISGDKAEVVFLAKVPSVSFTVFDVVPSAAPCSINTGLAVTDSTLENSRYKVTIDANGDVASVFDKLVGKELLASPARLEMHRDNPESWFSWEIWYKDIKGAPLGYVQNPVKARVVERGPARATIEITRVADGSTFIQRISLGAGGAGDRVELDTAINWQTLSTLIKAVFPFTASNPTATYDLGLGTIERGNDTERKYEVPAQQWADITSADGSYGVTVLNDCKYGWDKPADNTLRLSIVRNPAAGHYEGINDAGSHLLRYAICGHAGDWRQGGVSWQATRLNQPLYAFQAPKHGGTRGKSLSMLQVNSPQVAVRAFKKAEDSDELVIRLQELQGKSAEGLTLSFAAPVISAREMRGDEQPLGEAVVKDGRVVVDMTPYQPKTIAVKLASAKSKLSPPLCRTLDLPYDLDVVSPNDVTGDGDIDGKGNAIPRELFPASVNSDGIVFNMGPTRLGRKNALVCHGQTIALDAHKGDSLYLLAASVDGDQKGAFGVGGKQIDLNIYNYTGFIGQWNSRVENNQILADIDLSKVKPGFIKRQPVGWMATHRHNSKGGNDAYVYCYLFKYRIDLPEGVSSVTLPDNDRILIFAATVADDPNDDLLPAQLVVAEPPDVADLAK